MTSRPIDGTNEVVYCGIRTHQGRPYRELVERWRQYEAMGFDSLWLSDHLVNPSRPSLPCYEAWTLLAALATCTSTVRVGVLVSCNALRHPALLAREATTVDHVSGGRLEVGLGAGWYTPELRMCGIRSPLGPEAIAAFEEAVQVCDLLMRNTRASFDGRHYQLRDARSAPLPIQRPRPRLTIGAHSRKMLGVTARHADGWSSYRFDSAADVGLRNRILDELCIAAGRAPADVRRSLAVTVRRPWEDPWSSVDAFRDTVGRYRRAGIQELIFDTPRDCQHGVLERVATDVLPGLQARPPPPVASAAPQDR